MIDRPVKIRRRTVERRDELVAESVDDFVETSLGDPPKTQPSGSGPDEQYAPVLLQQSTVLMTVLAQDPTVLHGEEPVVTRIPVPAQRLQEGPCGHRFKVEDIDEEGNAHPAAVLHDREHPWAYADRWASVEPTALLGDRDFVAQNVFAVAAHTLALFERHLGRPIPWRSGLPQLILRPQAKIRKNASYSPTLNGVEFGWFPAKPTMLTALSFDIVAHEVTHAILDGLRPRYISAGLPDQRAFHEALADLVALLSVFTLPGVVERLLPDGPLLKDPDQGLVDRGARTMAANAATESTPNLIAGRAEALMRSPLLRLAEQVGSRGSTARDGSHPTALRASVTMKPTTEWTDDPAFEAPHRRAEILVAAFLHTLVGMWVSRLTPFDASHGMDTSRVAEEGVRAAKHLLAMLLRSLDYLPPVDLEFADVIDSVLTADERLAPDDGLHYRDALTSAFAAFGIKPPEHRIVDEDGLLRGPDGTPLPEEPTVFPPDPDAIKTGRLRYENLNVTSLRTSPEEVHKFLWNNAARLGIDVRFDTRVERVIASTRVGPDGLVITEVIADYVQTVRRRLADLPAELIRPKALKSEDVVDLSGGGVLVFDQFGRFRLHQRKPLTDLARQSRKLAYLASRGSNTPEGFGLDAETAFNELHDARWQE